MTEQRDEAIISALRGLEDDGGSGAAPVARLLKRGRKARGRRIAAVSGTGLCLLAVAAGLVVAKSPGTGSQLTPSVRIASLASAAQTTAETSFHVKITIPPMRLTSSSTVDWAASLVVEGAYDPATEDGYLNQVNTVDWSGSSPEIVVGGTCYIGDALQPGEGASDRWQRVPGECFVDGGPGFGINPIADPDALLRQLGADDSAKLVSRSGSGSSEVDVWSYSYTGLNAPNGKPTMTLSGTATVDAATQHVTQLLAHLEGNLLHYTTAVYDFSGFGAPVNATRPIEATPTNTSK